MGDKSGDGEDDDTMPLVIDDHAPPPSAHAPVAREGLEGSGRRARPVARCRCALVASWTGGGRIHAQEYLFFTKAALVTFGGAYAVLAYVTQAVTVAPYSWLTPAQAVDGLALAETTPGPLIMVLQFVGFMAGWNHPPAGWSPAASGVVGALVTTYATFLPCFVFIFVGAPYIEVIRGKRALRARSRA